MSIPSEMLWRLLVVLGIFLLCVMATLIWVRRMCRRDRRKFPQKVIGHWYCGAWYMHLSRLRESGQYSGTNLNPDPDEVSSPAQGRRMFT